MMGLCDLNFSQYILIFSICLMWLICANNVPGAKVSRQIRYLVHVGISVHRIRFKPCFLILSHILASGSFMKLLSTIVIVSSVLIV